MCMCRTLKFRYYFGVDTVANSSVLHDAVRFRAPTTEIKLKQIAAY